MGFGKNFNSDIIFIMLSLMHSSILIIMLSGHMYSRCFNIPTFIGILIGLSFFVLNFISYMYSIPFIYPANEIIHGIIFLYTCYLLLTGKCK